MKRKQAFRRLDQLLRASRELEGRYLSTVMNSTSWTSDACYSASSFVALLHSEIEQTLEGVARDSVLRASQHTQHFEVHPILLNAVSYFRGEVAARMHHLLEFVPTRASLAADSAALHRAWDSGGARVWYFARVSENHGAGINYIADLLHPLGLQVLEKDYKRTSEARGLAAIGAVSPAEGDELRKFVRLRGAVVHGGYASSKEAFQPHSPVDVRNTSQHAVEAVMEVSAALVKCW